MVKCSRPLGRVATSKLWSHNGQGTHAAGRWAEPHSRSSGRITANCQVQQQQQDHTELGEDAFRQTPEDETEARPHQIAAGAAREAPQRQRRGGWFQKCQELSDAILKRDHGRAMELAHCYRDKKHKLEKVEKAQDQGYYSKK